MVVNVPAFVFIATSSVTFYKVLVAGVYILAVLGLVTWLLIWKRRLKRAVVDTRGSLCVQCLYDLRMLPAPGTCPECATPFPADRNISHWINADMIMRFETREPPSIPTASSAPDTNDASPPPENR